MQRLHHLRRTALIVGLAACTSVMATSSTPSASSAAAAPPAPDDLQCQMHATAEPGGPVRLRFTLRHAGTQDLHLLRWGSPFEGAWFGRFVQVMGAQGELPFQGALRKRGEPAAADYLLLRAGQTLEASLTLDDAFALPARGPLRLRAGWRWHDVMAGGTPPRPRAAHQGRDQACGELTLTR